MSSRQQRHYTEQELQDKIKKAQDQTEFRVNLDNRLDNQEDRLDAIETLLVDMRGYMEGTVVVCQQKRDECREKRKVDRHKLRKEFIYVCGIVLIIALFVDVGIVDANRFLDYFVKLF